MKSGMKTLRQDGWRKVLAGQTTVDEVARVTAGDIVG
jgi:general secretion pathway protein E/type IV pilus assembly protein PilB